MTRNQIKLFMLASAEAHVFKGEIWCVKHNRSYRQCSCEFGYRLQDTIRDGGRNYPIRRITRWYLGTKECLLPLL